MEEALAPPLNKRDLLRRFAVEVATLEVKPDVGFISDNPCIMPWREQLGITWTNFTLGAIIHAHMQAARKAIV